VRSLFESVLPVASGASLQHRVPKLRIAEVCKCGQWNARALTRGGKQL
jgi:hypothetical protein